MFRLKDLGAVRRHTRNAELNWIIAKAAIGIQSEITRESYWTTGGFNYDFAMNTIIRDYEL